MKQTILSLFVLFTLMAPLSPAVAEGLVTCDGPDCNLCSVIDLANTIIDFTFVIAILIATILIVYAGFLLVFSQGDPGAVSKGKTMLTNAIIGLIIMLAAWTIVDTFMKTFAGGEFGVWNEVAEDQCGGAYKAGVAKDVNIEIKGDDGISFSTVVSFGSDHGNGSTGLDPMSGSGGNCPGASGNEVLEIPGETGKFLRADARTNFIAMRDAAATDGIMLRVSSAWRSQATQEEIWKRHNCDVVNCSGIVARPCSKGGGGSNHNGGVAVDIHGSSPRGTAIYNWLKANGGRYNFNNNLGPSDPLHWSPSGR